PTIQGVLALYDGDDGRPLALMDSIELTALRTGAATAVAARRMARPEAQTLALCGCGAQAPYQVRALRAVRPLRHVRVFDRGAGRAARLAASRAGSGSFRVEAVEDWRGAARQADIVVTCSSSREPVVGPDDVRPGAFVAGVGADNPG